MKMDQGKFDKFFMDTAKGMAEMSSCIRLKVGAVLTLNNRLIGSGYNGTPSGFKHCDELNDHLDLNTMDGRNKHHSFSSKFEIHSEVNAIIDMAKRGLSPEGSTLYVTTAPCQDCAKLVIAAGVKRVVYAEEYDREKYKDPFMDLSITLSPDILYEELSGIKILQLAGIKVEKV
jgi:dCMP deaminase